MYLQVADLDASPFLLSYLVRGRLSILPVLTGFTTHVMVMAMANIDTATIIGVVSAFS